MSQANRSQKKTGIKCVAKTWIKDSHGLFDYQAKQDQHKKPDIFNIFESTYVLKQFGTCATILKPTVDIAEQIDKSQTGIVGEVVVDRSKAYPSFKIKGNKKKQGQIEYNYVLGKTPFIVVKDYHKNGYPLHPGNIIKLGRIEYMVLEVRNNKQTYTLRDTNHFQEINGTFQVKEKLEDAKTQFEADQTLCKVCLCGEENQQDPLISPCNCKGFCGLIHVHCLKTWINSKVKKQLTGIAVSYNFAKFQCQICKYPFPKKIKNKEKEIQMMTITKPNKPYLILESLDPLKDNKVERCLHLIETDQKASIKIGRGHQCEIRLTDISVSRRHAQITLINDQFFLKDTQAKFGTLVLFQGSQLVNRRKTLKIQMGRTLYQFSVQDLTEQVDTQ